MLSMWRVIGIAKVMWEGIEKEEAKEDKKNNEN